jgi:hypothetical protein
MKIDIYRTIEQIKEQKVKIGTWLLIIIVITIINIILWILGILIARSS